VTVVTYAGGISVRKLCRLHDRLSFFRRSSTITDNDYGDAAALTRILG